MRWTVFAVLALFAFVVVLVALPSVVLVPPQLPAPGTPAVPSAVAIRDIPPNLLGVYQQAAATCPGLPWQDLAGIGKVESDHARSTAPGVHSGANFAGAMGPMQFLAPTWNAYRVAAPGHTAPDVYDPADSIYTAARYLCRLGAGDPSRLRQAIFGYNHDLGYVDAVLGWAQRYAILPTMIGGLGPGQIICCATRAIQRIFATVPATGFDTSAFPYGQCTWWAAYNGHQAGTQPVTWGQHGDGNASQWLADAQAQGVPTSQTPTIGAIVVWPPAPAGYSPFGHVATVIAVQQGYFVVSEMNFEGEGIIDQRRIPWPNPTPRPEGFIL